MEGVCSVQVQAQNKHNRGRKALGIGPRLADPYTGTRMKQQLIKGVAELGWLEFVVVASATVTVK